RATRQGADHGGVGLTGHPDARAFVFAIAGANLFCVKNAGDAFDVGGNQDLHKILKKIDQKMRRAWRGQSHSLLTHDRDVRQDTVTAAWHLVVNAIRISEGVTTSNES